jgi:predicted dehydrogenase
LAGKFFGLPGDRIFTDAENLLRLEEIQGVVILTPNYNHCPMTELAASYRKHVMITKPMARNVEEGRRMIKACRDHGVQLFVSFMHRYLNGIKEAKQLIADGMIGQVEMVRVLNAPGATSTVSKWFYKKENVGGGCVLDIGVHGIDIVRYVVGEIDEVLYARTGFFRQSFISEGEVVIPDNEDNANAIYRTKSGAIVEQSISWHHWSPADRFSMDIFGSEGTILLRGAMGTVAMCSRKLGNPGTWITPVVHHERLGKVQHQDFVDMIRNQTEANPNGEEGLRSLVIATGVYQSSEKGMPVKV